MTKAVYVSDDGNSYCVSLPEWEATVENHAGTSLQTNTACTTQAPLPKGYQRRKRYYAITAGGKGSITVLDPASALYTDAAGTALVVPLFDAATPGADNATLTGRTGEKFRS